MKKLIVASKYTQRNHTLCHDNGQDQVSQSTTSLFIIHAIIKGKTPKYLAVFCWWKFSISDKLCYFWERCWRCGQCRWVGPKKKIQGSLMAITRQDNSKNIVFLNITCGFRNWERTIGNFSFRKERHEFTMHQIKIV